MRRAVLVAGAIAVVAVAAGVTVWAVAGSSEPVDPNEAAVTALCRDAAEDYPGFTQGRLRTFTVSEMTHETEDGILFYRAKGSASAEDGFGGSTSRVFQCRTKQRDGQDWELIDITML